MRRLIALFVLLFAACSAPLTRAPENGESAEYRLATVDGHRLPHLQGAGSSIAQRELLGGALHLRADGRFHMELTYGAGPGLVATETFDGVWTRAGRAIDLEFCERDIGRAVIRDGAIVLEFDGAVHRWER